MFKKFAILLAPFMLAPLGSLLTPSAAHANTTYWTPTKDCKFSARDYTRWSARIEVRSSDSAARAIQVKYGYGNSERISRVKVWENRVIDGNSQSFPSITLDSGNRTDWTSPIFNPPQTWISTLGSRYVNVTLFNADGRTCTSKIEFQGK